MAMDRSFVERNRASSRRIRALAESLSDEDLQRPVGKHWTVSIALAHLAFWDRRVLLLLDRLEQTGKLEPLEIDLVVNDVALPFWAAMPPRAAARLAVATVEALDKRLEEFPEALLAQVRSGNERWIVRALHRDPHLDAVTAALGC
jgi:hypothetical protein